jgi:outer membrane protein
MKRLLNFKMKKFTPIHLLLFFLFLLASGSSVIAQKYGYMNSGNVLEQMPERFKADAELEAFQAPLIAEGKNKVKALELKVEVLYKQIESGELTQVKIQNQQQILQKEQDEIAAFELTVQEKTQKKRQELLEPILKKIQNAIDEVAKEHGYALILDSSLFNTILYAEDAEDITSLVKAKLGI